MEHYFNNLIKEFNALNTLYTFCSIQRKMQCTYQVLSTSISLQTGQTFTKETLGVIKFIVKDLLHLNWIMIDERNVLIIEFTDIKAGIENKDS